MTIVHAHLNHEILDASVENGVSVVTTLGQNKEVLTGAGSQVAVELQVQVSQVGV